MTLTNQHSDVTVLRLISRLTNTIASLPSSPSHVGIHKATDLRGDWKHETWHRETIKIVGTDIARLDVRPCSKGGHRETWQRGTKSQGWTSWDLTWDHVARVDIARLVSMFEYLLTNFFCYYECYTNCRYQFVLIVFRRTHGARFTEARMSARHQCEASTWRHEAHFAAVVRGWRSWRFQRRWSHHWWHGRLTGLVLAAAVVITRL